MLSACSWEGIALQREQLTTDVHCVADVRCARASSQIPACTSAPTRGSLLPGTGVGGKGRCRDNLILGAALGWCRPRQTGTFGRKPKQAG